MSFIYLASPYTHGSADVREERYWAAVTKAAMLMASGHCVFSPIAHSHGIGLVLDKPIDHDFWMEQDKALLQHADKMLVLKLDGWEESRGVRAELDFAAEKGIPVEYVDP